MSNYRKGVRAEYAVKKIFEDAGFIVTRASGSHSPFDLVATKMSPKGSTTVYIVALMQVKRKTINKDKLKV